VCPKLALNPTKYRTFPDETPETGKRKNSSSNSGKSLWFGSHSKHNLAKLVKQGF
jgi:hypothetical protein